MSRGGRRPGAGRPVGARDGGPRNPGSGGARKGAGRPRGSPTRNRIAPPPPAPLVDAVRAAVRAQPEVSGAELVRQLGAPRSSVYWALRRVRAEACAPVR